MIESQQWFLFSFTYWSSNCCLFSAGIFTGWFFPWAKLWGHVLSQWMSEWSMEMAANFCFHYLPLMHLFKKVKVHKVRSWIMMWIAKFVSLFCLCYHRSWLLADYLFALLALLTNRGSWAHKGTRNLVIGFWMASYIVLHQSNRGSNVSQSTLKFRSSAICYRRSRRIATIDFQDLHDRLKTGSFTSYEDSCINKNLEGYNMAECCPCWSWAIGQACEPSIFPYFSIIETRKAYYSAWSWSLLGDMVKDGYGRLYIYIYIYPLYLSFFHLIELGNKISSPKL